MLSQFKIAKTCGLIAVLIGLAGNASPAVAQEDEAVLLQGIVLGFESLATLETSRSTIDEKRLSTEYSGARIGDILQSIPGVTASSGESGDAEIGINIRGLQDHGRVVVTIDGVRQNFARSGHNANGSFSVDSEMLREINVQRGPGGKPGAIAGSVEMRTVRANDLLPDNGVMGGEFRVRAGSLSASPTFHGAFATRLGDTADLTFALTRSEKADYTAPDGTKIYAWQKKLSGLFALGVTTQNGNRFRFSGSALAQDYVLGRNTNTIRNTSSLKRTYTLDFDLPDIGPGWQAEGGIYQTTTSVSQITVDSNLNPTGAIRRYQTGTQGLRFLTSGAFDTGALEHEVSISFEGFRDTVETRANVGSLTPSGIRDVWSIDIKDRVDFGLFSATFGADFNSYSLRSATVNNTGHAFSPRLAINMPLGNGFHLFTSATATFRPPSLNETLVDGEHPEPARFEVRPNPNLKPERAKSFEIGLGYERDGIFTGNDVLDIRATVFKNTITDFIGLEQVGTIFDNYFQYQNVDKVEIKGLELEANYDSDRVFASFSGQIMRGTDLTTGNDLSRVGPARMVLSGGMRSADERTSYGARFTVSAAKKDTAGIARSKSWHTLDLFLNHDITDQARFSLTLNNVTNESYTPHLQTLPQPGFNAQASLVVRF